jgi:hypothetical protein
VVPFFFIDFLKGRARHPIGGVVSGGWKTTYPPKTKRLIMALKS